MPVEWQTAVAIREWQSIYKTRQILVNAPLLQVWCRICLDPLVLQPTYRMGTAAFASFQKADRPVRRTGKERQGDRRSGESKGETYGVRMWSMQDEPAGPRLNGDKETFNAETFAPFFRNKWRWTDSDCCWWCNRGRQSQGLLFKECKEWKRGPRLVGTHLRGEERT